MVTSLGSAHTSGSSSARHCSSVQPELESTTSPFTAHRGEGVRDRRKERGERRKEKGERREGKKERREKILDV